VTLGVGGRKLAADIAGAGDKPGADRGRFGGETDGLDGALRQRNLVVGDAGDQQVLPDREPDIAVAEILCDFRQTTHLRRREPRHRQHHADPIESGLQSRSAVACLVDRHCGRCPCCVRVTRSMRPLSFPALFAVSRRPKTKKPQPEVRLRVLPRTAALLSARRRTLSAVSALPTSLIQVSCQVDKMTEINLNSTAYVNIAVDRRAAESIRLLIADATCDLIVQCNIQRTIDKRGRSERLGRHAARWPAMSPGMKSGPTKAPMLSRGSPSSGEGVMPSAAS